ncbi:MAG: hypothetical protein U1E62_10440 [Alsobacter sp.]
MRTFFLAASVAALVFTGAAAAEARSKAHRSHVAMQGRNHHAHARPWYFGRSQDWAAAPRAYRRDRADFDGWVTDKGIR